MPIDSDPFKAALSRWCSGVTVVTARTREGQALGLTASSFASLSLQPPLVLFCLGEASTNFEAFQTVQGFAIHILAAGQQELANRFASRREDRFAGLACGAGHYGAPLLPDCLAVLQCRAHARLPGGDHVIVVGAVEAVTLGEQGPLLYYRGDYRGLADGGA